MVHRYPLPWSVHMLYTLWHAFVVLYAAIGAIHINLSPAGAPATGPGGLFRYFTSWVLMMQFVYFLFALAFDALQWTVWFTTSAPVRAVANTGGWPPHSHIVQAIRLHFDRFFFLMFAVAGGMGGLVNLQWLIGCISTPPCENMVANDLMLIHAQPFWWAVIELVLVPHYSDSSRHPPWWVDMGVIVVFLSSWAIHYFTFYALTDRFVYGDAWPPTRWLLYSCILPLYGVIRLLTIIRFKLAVRCGRRWPYRFGYLLTMHPTASTASVSSASSGASSAKISEPSTRLSSALSIGVNGGGLPSLPPNKPMIASFHDLSTSNSGVMGSSGTPDGDMLISIHHAPSSRATTNTTTIVAATSSSSSSSSTGGGNITHGTARSSSSLSIPMDVPMVVSPPRSAPRSPLIAPMTPGSLGSVSSISPTNSLPSPLHAIPSSAAAVLHDQSARRTSSNGHTRGVSNGNGGGHVAGPSGRYSSRGTIIGSMDVPVVYHRHSITDFDAHLLPHGNDDHNDTVANSQSHPSNPLDDDDDHDGALISSSHDNNNNTADDYTSDASGRMLSPASASSSISSSSSSGRRVSWWTRFVRWNGSPIIVTLIITSACIITWDIAWIAGIRP